jgi:hypothetical protein
VSTLPSGGGGGAAGEGGEGGGGGGGSVAGDTVCGYDIRLVYRLLEHIYTHINMHCDTIRIDWRVVASTLPSSPSSSSPRLTPAECQALWRHFAYKKEVHKTKQNKHLQQNAHTHTPIHIHTPLYRFRRRQLPSRLRTAAV